MTHPDFVRSRHKHEQKLGYLLIGTVIVNLAMFFFITMNLPRILVDTGKLAGALGLLAFVCLHGWHRYGWYKMLVFFILTFAISWSAESLSIATGFPFGVYHYTGLIGDKLGAVPIMIIPAYFLTGYLAWTMGGIFAGGRGTGMAKGSLIRVPLIAALIMVLWDVCFDPVLSTIEGNWVWEEGGAYFGVPLSNFGGWFLTVYLIFQAFAIFLRKSGPDIQMTTGRSYWYLVPVLYAGQGLPYLLYPLFKTDHLDIYRPLSLITLFTMVFTALLNILFIRRFAGSSDDRP